MSVLELSNFNVNAQQYPQPKPPKTAVLNGCLGLQIKYELNNFQKECFSPRTIGHTLIISTNSRKTPSTTKYHFMSIKK